MQMNANELADKLENALDEDSWCQECALENTDPVARQAATMLRQLQAENGALKSRELTDEEIYEIWRTCDCSPDDPVCFAKAILRKAQEK